MARSSYGTVPLIVLAALIINLALFSMIEYMVGLRQIRLSDTTDIRIANFIRMTEPSRAVRSRRSPDAPQKPAKDMQQDIERLSQARTGHISGLSVDLPQIEIEFDLGGDIQIARELTPLVRIPPEYPFRALAKGIEGYVLLRFRVTETGSVADPEVLRSDPPALFDRAARQAVMRWKFQPQFRDGKPVSVVTYTRVRFKMQQEPE